MRITLGDVTAQYRTIKDEIDTAIREVVESGQFILGEKVAQIEEEIAAFSGARYAVGVNSGTDALLLALRALGIQPGDEVVTTPFTFVATAETIALVGARPVFADIDPRTFNLDPEHAAAAITPKTRAIMPVDLYGQMADRDAFCALAEKHGMAVIWDSAQAIGARFNDQPLGSFPGAATLSFYPTKNLGAYGDGGMILTNDEAVRDRLLQLRYHGSGGGYYYTQVGYCSRLDALQAAILSAKLKHLPEWNERRRANAREYFRLLQDTCSVVPYCDPRAYHTYHQFTIRHSRRDELREYLKQHGVDAGVYYPRPLHMQEAYAWLGYRQGDFPHAERAATEVLSIPVYPELRRDQLEYVAQLIRDFDS